MFEFCEQWSFSEGNVAVVCTSLYPQGLDKIWKGTMQAEFSNDG
jgi:hypothetical protein